MQVENIVIDGFNGCMLFDMYFVDYFVVGVDFVIFLESDVFKLFFGNNDFGMWLGEKLGMYVDFGFVIKIYIWGLVYYQREVVV